MNSSLTNSSLNCRSLSSLEITALEDHIGKNNKNFSNFEEKNLYELEQIQECFQQQLSKVDNFLIKNNADQQGFGTLPYDCLMNIVLLVDSKDIFNIVRTCKSLNALSNNPAFLKNLVQLQTPKIFTLCEPLKLNSWVYYGKAAFTLGRIEYRLEKIIKLHETVSKTQIATFLSLGLLFGFLHY